MILQICMFENINCRTYYFNSMKYEAEKPFLYLQQIRKEQRIILKNLFLIVKSELELLIEDIPRSYPYL